jgi:phosphoenolpyruvate carboxylase
MTKKIVLSKTIHLLGEILGNIIKEQEGLSLFNKIEKIRALSKSSRGNRSKNTINRSFTKLKREISKLNAKDTLVIARSFSKFLDFSNIAESLFSIHNIHDHNIRKTQETNEIVILEEAILDVFKNKSLSLNKFYETAKNLKIEIVLTAHPTQVKRRTLIQKYAKVNHLLDIFNNLRIFTKQNINLEKNLLQIIFMKKLLQYGKQMKLKDHVPLLLKKQNGDLL